MNLSHSVLSALSLALGAASVSAAVSADTWKENWPQWRGPEANGAAAKGAPPTTWSESENVAWKRKIPGSGTGSPIVWQDRIFLLTAIPAGKKDQPAGEAAPAPAAAEAPAPQPPPPGGGPGPGGPGDRGPGRRRGGGPGGGSQKPTEAQQFVVLCLDRKTGDVVWQKTAREEVPHEGHHPDHGFASASPITDGEFLYAYFGSHGLYCYDLNGNLKWEKDLGDMNTRNSFGEGSSPAIHGDKIVINWDHEGADFIVALDKKTGNEIWRQNRDENTTWTTPLIVEHEGKAQVVVAATNKIRSYDLETGKQIWECGGMTANVIPTPVSAFDMVYPISGFRGASLLAVKLGRTGDLTGSDAIAWQVTKGTPYVPSPLLIGERLYFYSGNNGILSSFDAKTGKAFFETERIPALQGGVYASPVAVGDHGYFVGRDGTTVVLKIGDKPEVIATNKLDAKIDASPALAGNQLFLRSHDNLYCIASAEKK